MALRFIILISSFFFLSQKTEAQHTYLDIPLHLSEISKNHFTQSIDISTFKANDFLTFSLVIKGKNINYKSVSGKLISSTKSHDIIPFGEVQYDEKFVSELLYLDLDEIGKMTLDVIILDRTTIDDLEGNIHIFSPDTYLRETKDTDTTAINYHRSSCECPKPINISRQNWGQSYNLNGNIYIAPAVYTDVTHLIVHHSAGTNTSTNWKGVVASIFDFHVFTNGWQDVGYNWLIDPNGILYEGRGGGDNVKGAHMCGYNSNTMGICLLGNFVETSPSEVSIQALKKLLAWKSCKEGIAPFGMGPILSYIGVMNTISGHRDGCAPSYTACPGQKLYDKLDTIKLITDQFILDTCATTNTINTLISTEFQIFPNPGLDNISLMYQPSPAAQIKIIDHMGMVCYSIHTNETDNITNIDISTLHKGIYTVQRISNGKISSKLFVRL